MGLNDIIGPNRMGSYNVNPRLEKSTSCGGKPDNLTHVQIFVRGNFSWQFSSDFIFLGSTLSASASHWQDLDYLHGT